MAIKVKKIKPEFVDERGGIARMLYEEIKKIHKKKLYIQSILRITHKKNTQPRGNHFHKKDYHWVYVESGKMEYLEKSQKKNAKVEKVILKPGDMVLSNPGVIHAMNAIEDTVFWAFSTEGREQDQYEGDTVRIKIV